MISVPGGKDGAASPRQVHTPGSYTYLEKRRVVHPNRWIYWLTANTRYINLVSIEI